MNPAEIKELFAAHEKIRAAAIQIADAGIGNAELEKLAGEVMTMASVTEIVAYAMQDESEGQPTFLRGASHGNHWTS